MSQTVPGEVSGVAPIQGPLLIDAHVHLHSAHDPSRLLKAAAANGRKAAARMGLAKPVVGLIVVDMRGQDGFSRLRDGTWTVPGWEMGTMGDPISLMARSSEGETVLLFAGRQMATRERLEVLSLLSDRPVPDGLDLSETVRRVHAAGGLPVIPWGFGKWTGQRRDLLKGFLENAPYPVFLGDSGGRPAIDRAEILFGEAAGRGIWNLPGTDPLPLSWEERRAGECGFILRDGLPGDRPGEALRQYLAELAAQPELYGRRRSLPGCLVSQIGLRLPGLKPAGGVVVSRPA